MGGLGEDNAAKGFNAGRPVAVIGAARTTSVSEHVANGSPLGRPLLSQLKVIVIGRIASQYLVLLDELASSRRTCCFEI